MEDESTAWFAIIKGDPCTDRALDSGGVWRNARSSLQIESIDFNRQGGMEAMPMDI